MSAILKAENISKQYRLGTVGSGTLGDDLKRWWYGIRGKEDPFLKIGAENDRGAKADSDYVWALRNINFEVEQGEVLGIIGKNGAGKSTLLKLLSRVTSPTTGSIKTRGRIASLLEVGTGFHGELTGRENIFMNGAVLGMTKTEIKSKLDEIIDFSGCEKYIDTPVKRYSSGMTVRLGFAVAAHLEPEILVVDEVLAVGDADFQKKALGKMQDLSSGEGRTVLFVSHNMVSIEKLCTRCLVIKNGLAAFNGPTKDSVRYYLSEQKKVNAFTKSYSKNFNDSAEIENIKCSEDDYSYSNLLVSGQKIIFEVEIKANADLNNLNVGLGFYSENNVPQFHCSTNTILKNFSEVKKNNKFRAKLIIPKWPLGDGDFYVNAFIRENGNLIEHLEKCYWVSSKKGDYYGSGKLPSWNEGFYCEYDWKK
ncbi:ABC transporter ATP-binding protein [Gramella sp. BOM4]|nr:ABC transporter ATP-binding protein [Christiangramia bathymodioli]